MSVLVDIPSKLQQAGLRVTRPRTEIARLLFADGADRHVTAEWIAGQLSEAGTHVSLATVYNTLHNFLEAGLLREVRGAGTDAIVFDPNLRAHHHLYDETTGALSDIPADAVSVTGAPDLPNGKEIVACEVVFRVR